MIRKFSCLNCGYSYDIAPPDSSYKYAFITQCQKSSGLPNHNFQTFKECDNCGNRNNLFWCQGHAHVYGTGNRRNFSRIQGLSSCDGVFSV